MTAWSTTVSVEKPAMISVLPELHPELANNPAALARFLREAKITGQLEHPGVVPVYELARDGEEANPFYTMRFISGRTLTQASLEYHQTRFKSEQVSLDLSALLHAFVMVCNTIGFAHSRGIIHRDLKGQNVVLGEFGEVVVLDWGLAKLVGVSDEVEPAGLNESDNADLTQHGHALGTPAWMAPEQAAGRLDQIDHRTDIYGLGTILYEILTGHSPFSGTNREEVLRKVREEKPPQPRQICPDVPFGLQDICLKALARKPEDRYGTAKELAVAVQQWQDAERIKAEEALRANEERYRMLADAIPQIVWTSTLDGGNEYFNQRWFAYTGLTPEQSAGDGWKSIVHPDDLASTMEKWSCETEQGARFAMEHRLRGADGTYRWHLGLAMPWRDASGQIVKWFGTCTDIDDQKRREEDTES
jgi:PAS domain S-box-containing protein